MSQEEHFGQRILAAYDGMPRAERRLADLLLEDPDVLSHATAGDLAQRAGVSKATAARLFRRLGYPGYKAAQREIRLGRAEGSRSAVPPDAAIESEPLSPGAYLDVEVRHLVRSFELLRADDISRAVDLLSTGEKLWVVGFGDDYALAHFARSLLIKLRPDIRMIPIGGFPVPEEFASISPADTVLALGIGRRTQEFRNVMGSAARSQARIVLVADRLQAGDKSQANVILRSRSSGPTLFGSMTAGVSLLSYLCARLAWRMGDSAAERLSIIESIHADWGNAARRDDP